MPKRTQYLYDVFISYSHADRDWVVKRLLPRLENAGLKVCIDERDFETGIPSLINMTRAVDNSKHTLIVMTEKWVESAWTEFESLLIATKDPAARLKRLLPLKLAACEPPDYLAYLTYADFTKLRNRAQAFERLLKQIQPRTANRQPKKSTPPSAAREPSAPKPSGSTMTTVTVEPALAELPAFVVGLPIIHPRHFFGHGLVIKRLFDLLKRRPLQNAIVLGPRRSGKTSLLLYLRNLTMMAATAPEQLRPDQRNDLLPQPERYRWIFVDFQDPRLGSRQGLLGYLLINLGLAIPNPCDLERFLDAVSGNLQTPTVILFDEIDVALERYPELDNSFWEGLRSLATTQVDGYLSFILAASERPGRLAQQNGIGSPFFNIFGYTVNLKPLTEQEAQALMANSPIMFPTSDIDWILSTSGRWPILLQILCRERLFALEEGAIDEAWRTEGLRQIEPFRHLLETR